MIADARLGAESETGAMAALFDRAHTSIEGYVDAFSYDERQVGVVFFVNGRPVHDDGDILMLGLHRGFYPVND